jgi:hypothetical protein
MPKHNENIQHATTMTKRQRARWEQERIKQRRVVIAVASVIGLVVALVTIGLLVDKVIVPNKTVANVNGVEISNGQYQTYRKITQAQRAINTYSQAQQFAQFQQQSGDQFGPQITADIEALKAKSTAVDYEILDQMIDNQVITTGTAAQQIVITDEELQRSLAEKFNVASEPAPVPTTVPVSGTGTLTGTAALTPTTPVSPTAVPTLTVPESQSKVDTAIQTYFGTLKEFIEVTSTYGTAKLPFTLAEFKAFVLEQERIQLLRERLGEALVSEDQAAKEVYADADQIFIQVTVPPTETAEISATAWTAGKAQIDSIAKELESGKDFEVVQKEKSQYTDASGGKSISTGLRPLTEYASFGITEPISTQEIGVIGEPYRSEQGWHIVRVKQRELRPSKSDLDTKRGEAISKWITEKRTASNVQRFPEPTATPAPPTVEPLPTELPAEVVPTAPTGALTPTLDLTPSLAPASQATPTP